MQIIFRSWVQIPNTSSEELAQWLEQKNAKKTEKLKAKISKLKDESLKFFTIKAENAKCKVLLNLR